MENRESQNDLAARIRTDYQRGKRRRKIVSTITISLTIIAAIAVLGLLRMSDKPEPENVRTPANATSDYGFTLTQEKPGDGSTGTDVVAVDIYDDFLCGSCKHFHETTSEYLVGQVDSGEITLTYHPFAFLISKSTNEYSLRAANAAVCVADELGPQGYAQMHDILMMNQPSIDSAGLTDKQLIEFAQDSGASDAAACIKEQHFSDWVEKATKSGIDAEVTITPTIRVANINVVRSTDGKETVPGPEEIQYAIETIRGSE